MPKLWTFGRDMILSKILISQFSSKFKIIFLCGQEYDSLNILWLNFMILGLKHNIIVGRHFV